MIPLRRAVWTAALLVLAAVATTAFAPPFVRPPVIRPPVVTPVIRPPVTLPPSTFRPSTVPGSFTGIRPGTFTGTNLGSGTFTGIRPGTFSGSTFTGITPGLRPPTYVIRTPSMIQGEVRGLITTRPTGALQKLGTTESRSLLPEATRLILAREAIEGLAIKVESGGNAAKNLTEVRLARQAGKDLPGEARSSLGKLEQLAERRALAEGIQEVRVPADRGNWGEASRQAKSWANELRGEAGGRTGPNESASFRAQKAEVIERLQEIHDLGKRIEALENFRSALKEFEAGRAGESASKLGQVDRTSLPKGVEAQYDGMRGLAEVKSIAGEKWTRPPEVGRVNDALGRLERGLAEVGELNPNLGKMIRQELAVKAAMEGHAETYFKLMPEGGPAEHAASLLRDFKATALGTGKIETTVVKSALPEPGTGTTSPRAPPGVEPLVPEGSRGSWRPPVAESAKTDLPPLEKATVAGATMKAQAEAKINPEKATLEGKAATARSNLGQVYQRVLAPEQTERRRFAEVETGLDRRLRPAERVRVRGWLETNRPTAQIVGDLRSQPGQDEESAFLADVERRLARKLTAAEKEQAKRLRGNGRTAAEVADILRT